MPQNILGVIGGSGFYQMKGLGKVEQMELRHRSAVRPIRFTGDESETSRSFFSRDTAAAIDCCRTK